MTLYLLRTTSYEHKGETECRELTKSWSAKCGPNKLLFFLYSFLKSALGMKVIYIMLYCCDNVIYNTVYLLMGEIQK